MACEKIRLSERKINVLSRLKYVRDKERLPDIRLCEGLVLYSQRHKWGSEEDPT